MKPYTSRKKQRSLNRRSGRSRSGVKLSMPREETTTAAAGIPADTKDMGPRFTAHNVMDRRKKKRPDVLKRFKIWLDALPPEAKP